MTDLSGQMLIIRVHMYRCPSTTTTATASKDAKMEQIELNQYRIAMVSEMIHTASLVHDDVIGERPFSFPS